MSKYVVATLENAYEFAPTSQEVIEADDVKGAAIALNAKITEDARAEWQRDKDAYEAQKTGQPAPEPEPATQPGRAARPKKKSTSRRLRDPGDFKEPKAQTVIVLDVENESWHTVSVSPPPPPPREEWDWRVKSMTGNVEEVEDDEDDEF